MAEGLNIYIRIIRIQGGEIPKAHKIFRRGDSKGSGEGRSARKENPIVVEAHGKNLSPGIEVFVTDTQRKEKLSKQGIEQLQEYARSLQQKLGETLHALKEREDECRRVREQEMKGKTSWLKTGKGIGCPDRCEARLRAMEFTRTYGRTRRHRQWKPSFSRQVVKIDASEWLN